MTLKLHESVRRVQFGFIVKLTSGCYFQIAQQAMQLLLNNIKGNVRNKNARNTTVLITRSVPFTFSFKKLNLQTCVNNYPKISQS